MKLKIDLYSVDQALRSLIRKEFTGTGYELTEYTDSSKPERVDLNEVRQPGAIGRLTLPEVCDAVVTKSGLNSKSEGLAASLALKQQRNDVYCYVLPEAMDVLRAKLDRLGGIVLVGADQAK